MASCNICGKNIELIRASIEGVTMDVCRECAGFGQVMYTPQTQPKAKAVKNENKVEIEERVVLSAAAKISAIRQKQNLTQEEFALKLNIKLNQLRAFESGRVVPDFDLARKIEKALNITLIEQVSDSTAVEKEDSLKSKETTLGDMITIKERKKK